MKIALFNYLPLEYGGGLARFYTTIARSLDQKHKNLRIDVVTLNVRSARFFQLLYSLYFFRNEKVATKNRSVGNLVSLYDLRRTLSSYDIVYTKNDLLELCILWVFVGFRAIKRLIIGFHTPIVYEMTPTWQSKFHNVLYSSFFYRFLLSCADAFHALNQSQSSWLRKRFAIPLYQIYNPVQHLAAAKKSVGNRTFRILWVGRLTTDKGIDDLIELIKATNNKYWKNIRWTIVGDGPMQQRVMALLTIYNNVDYFSHVESAKMGKLYTAHDLFLSTSRWECLPYVVLEAQMVGTPVVSYRIPGCTDIIQEGKTGYTATSFTDLKKKVVLCMKTYPFKPHAVANLTEKRFNSRRSMNEIIRMFRKTYEKPLR